MIEMNRLKNTWLKENSANFSELGEKGNAMTDIKPKPKTGLFVDNIDHATKVYKILHIKERNMKENCQFFRNGRKGQCYD